jgi:hypothetical protein
MCASDQISWTLKTRLCRMNIYELQAPFVGGIWGASHSLEVDSQCDDVVRRWYGVRCCPARAAIARVSSGLLILFTAHYIVVVDRGEIWGEMRWDETWVVLRIRVWVWNPSVAIQRAIALVAGRSALCAPRLAIVYSKGRIYYHAIVPFYRSTDYLTRLAIKGSSRQDKHFSLIKYFWHFRSTPHSAQRTAHTWTPDTSSSPPSTFRSTHSLPSQCPALSSTLVADIRPRIANQGRSSLDTALVDTLDPHIGGA